MAASNSSPLKGFCSTTATFLLSRGSTAQPEVTTRRSPGPLVDQAVSRFTHEVDTDNRELMLLLGRQSGGSGREALAAYLDAYAFKLHWLRGIDPPQRARATAIHPAPVGGRQSTPSGRRSYLQFYLGEAS